MISETQSGMYGKVIFSILRRSDIIPITYKIDGFDFRK